MLGSSAGTAHRQRQGTGLATVLGPSQSLHDFIRLDEREYAANQAEEQKRAAQATASRQKMLDFNPERWFKHEVDIRNMQNKWLDSGAQLLNGGVDPYSGTDPASLEWRKNKNKIEAYAIASKQVQEYHKTIRAKLDGSAPGTYDTASVQALQDYFETPIADIVEKNMLPPNLVERKPTENLQQYWVKTMADLQGRTGQGQFTDAERWAFIEQTRSSNPALQESIESYYQQLPPAMQDDIRQRARTAGRTEADIIHYDFMTRYEKQRDPFDLNKFVQAGADSIDVPYTQVSTPSGFGTYVDKKEMDRIAGEKAMLMLSSSPEALQAYEQVLPMMPNENEAAYRQRAIGHLKNSLIKLKSTKTVDGVTEKGQGDKEQAESSARWLSDVKSPDAQLHSEASGYLLQTRNLSGLTVRHSAIAQGPTNPLTGQVGGGPRLLVLTLDGKPSLQKVEEAAQDFGLPSTYRYETVSPDGQIIVPIDDLSENALLRFHDKAYKETSIPYKGPFKTRNVDDLMIPQGQQNTW